jgi:hypothetical protein
LLIASATGLPFGISSFKRSMIACAPSVSPRCASISRTMTSASEAPPQAALTMLRSSRRRGRKMPGVSTKTICAAPAIAIPRIRARVVCTLWVTMETFAPTIRFSSVDFPAFGSPIRATKPARVSVIPASIRSSSIRAAVCSASRFGRAVAGRCTVLQRHPDGEDRRMIGARAARLA